MTVLANEQVIDGTRLALGRAGREAQAQPVVPEDHRLRRGAARGARRRSTHWPDKVRLMQENWIGKSQGLQVPLRARRDRRRIDGSRSTPPGPTRSSARASSPSPPDHPLAAGAGRRRSATLAEFIDRMPRGGTTAAEIETAEKLGFDTGLERRPPARSGHGRCRVYIANFVLMEYGTGAIFGVPGARPARLRVRHANTACRSSAWSPPSAEEADAPIGDEAEAGDGVAGQLAASSTA